MAKAENAADQAEPETPAEAVAEAVAQPVVEAESDPDFVSYQVTKAGDGQIHTGEFDSEAAAPKTFKRGDVVHNVPIAIALGLEDRHYAEILD